MKIDKQKLEALLKKFTWCGAMPSDWYKQLAEFITRNEKDVLYE